MTKNEREIVRMKYNNHCSYCGCELQKGWHVDHVEPVRRGFGFDERIVMSHPERDCIENMMPSCASCNINKHGDTIEQFRNNIKGYLNSLNQRMVQYKMVKKYGLIEETNKPVIFYFETFLNLK
jgi:5-methylcytosine-specific restriction endonuclease McrA